jgi:hypothetical protein
MTHSSRLVPERLLRLASCRQAGGLGPCRALLVDRLLCSHHESRIGLTGLPPLWFLEPGI